MDVLISQGYWALFGVLFAIALLLVGFITAAWAWLVKKWKGDHWDNW